MKFMNCTSREKNITLPDGKIKTLKPLEYIDLDSSYYKRYSFLRTSEPEPVQTFRKDDEPEIIKKKRKKR